MSLHLEEFELIHYIKTFLPEKVPTIIHEGGNSKVSGVLLELNSNNIEPILYFKYKDDINFTIETTFLGINIDVIIRSPEWLEFNIGSNNEIKFSRIINKDDLLSIWQILERKKNETIPLNNVFELFCKKLEIIGIIKKMEEDWQKIMFLEFMAYLIILIKMADLDILYEDENIALLPWSL